MGLVLLVLLGLAAFVILTYNSLARLRLLASNAVAQHSTKSFRLVAMISVMPPAVRLAPGATLTVPAAS